MTESYVTSSTSHAKSVAEAILAAVDIARECDPLADIIKMIKANGGLVPLPAEVLEVRPVVGDMVVMEFIGDVVAGIIETLCHYQIISRETRWTVYANMPAGMVSVAPADLLYEHVAQVITDQQFSTHPELGN